MNNSSFSQQARDRFPEPYASIVALRARHVLHEGSWESLKHMSDREFIQLSIGRPWTFVEGLEFWEQFRAGKRPPVSRELWLELLKKNKACRGLVFSRRIRGFDGMMLKVIKDRKKTGSIPVTFKYPISHQEFGTSTPDNDTL